MGDIEVYDSITDLELSNNNHKLKVKILKTWRRPVFNNPKHTYSLEFVCADEQGNRAQGSRLASFFYRFERFLEEQNVLTIRKPLLGSNRVGTARHSVSNAFSNSNLFINDSDIEEITIFLDRFSETEDGQSTSTYKSGSLSVMISKEEDFLDVTDFIYSAQVADITEPKTVVVLGTIKLVTEGEPGSPTEVVTYYCKNPACNDTKKVIQAYPRYMVLLKVQDSTGTVDLTLFDSEAKKIIKKTALEVHDNYTPDPKMKEDVLAINVPDEIASFIDKRYAFKIGVTDNHINKRFKSYTIKALTDGEVIITAIDEKYFKHELGIDDSDFLSTQNTSGKEVIYICDDNVTLSSISNIAKLNADERESKQLKRNLDDSFENQELLTMSSAKKQSSSSNSELSLKGEFDGIVDGKLLIPKKEK
ncbi:hypothetical protein SSX86_003189 [Deinandra increscens subsp. villosa]|uniref:Uncharacterized protein n=1 Tax=Deinandra increscens subsp. villosa TaxID=3103831 RepID=A0AAP0DKM4_9ASTR